MVENPFLYPPTYEKLTGELTGLYFMALHSNICR